MNGAGFQLPAERNPAAALRLNQALILAADGLATFPNRGRPGTADEQLSQRHPELTN
jgi:hypothetical protein